MSFLRTLLELLLSIIDAVTSQIIIVAIIGIVLLLVAAVLAPLGALRWYAGWGKPPAKASPEPLHTAPVTQCTEAQRYLVYLSGIDDVSSGSLEDEELHLLNRLASVLPDTTIIHDIFSFSVDNVDLTQQWLGRFWQWCHQRKSSKGRFALFGQLINVRNLLQVAVSADRRYGPIYNYGTAGTIARTLLLHGYRVGSGKPITLLGYSGGGQIALGSAKYLHATLEAPIHVISLGGVINSDRSLETIARLDHLYGEHDYVQRAGAVIFPARWPLARYSRWNKALAAGVIQMVDMGPIAHNGAQGYFSAAATLPDGTSHLEHTVAVVRQLVCD